MLVHLLPESDGQLELDMACLLTCSLSFSFVLQIGATTLDQLKVSHWTLCRTEKKMRGQRRV
jgi:hypothetical protein